jgi:hypothetical protein
MTVLPDIRHIQLTLVVCSEGANSVVSTSLSRLLRSCARQIVVADRRCLHETVERLRSHHDPRVILTSIERSTHKVSALQSAFALAAGLGANVIGYCDLLKPPSPRAIRNCAMAVAQNGWVASLPPSRRSGPSHLATPFFVRADQFQLSGGFNQSIADPCAAIEELLERFAHIGHVGPSTCLAPIAPRVSRRSVTAAPDLKHVNISLCFEPRNYRRGCGVLYAAHGEWHIQLARFSILSLGLWCPGLPVATVGFDARGAVRLDAGRKIPPGWGCRRWKIGAFDLSPFERTIWLDADTVVNGDISELFGALDRCDLAAALDACSDFERAVHLGRNDQARTLAAAGHLWPQLNTGVLAFKKTKGSKRFFRRWLQEWERGGGQQDQGAAVRAMVATHPTIFTLGPQWNGVRDGSIVWHRVCEGRSQRDGRLGIVSDEVDLYERIAQTKYIRAR